MDPAAARGPSTRRLETLGAVVVIAAGTLLHDAYGWSGHVRPVGLVAPVNESVWEHLKLVLVPVIAYAGVEAVWITDRARLWWAKLVEVVMASVFIVAFFYTYTGALGVGSAVPVDIASYCVAVVGGQWVSERLLVGPGTWRPPLAASVAALGVLVVLFAVLTYAPPHVPLFRELSTGRYGPG